MCLFISHGDLISGHSHCQIYTSGENWEADNLTYLQCRQFGMFGIQISSPPYDLFVITISEIRLIKLIDLQLVRNTDSFPILFHQLQSIVFICSVIFMGKGTLASEKNWSDSVCLRHNCKTGKISLPAQSSPHILNPTQVLNDERLSCDPLLGYLCFRGNPLEVRGEYYLLF